MDLVRTDHLSMFEICLRLVMLRELYKLYSAWCRKVSEIINSGRLEPYALIDPIAVVWPSHGGTPTSQHQVDLSVTAEVHKSTPSSVLTNSSNTSRNLWVAKEFLFTNPAQKWVFQGCSWGWYGGFPRSGVKTFRIIVLKGWQVCHLLLIGDIRKV